MRPLTDAEERPPLFVVLQTDINPNAPDEGLLFTTHGDFETAAHIEPLVVDDAVVAAKGTAAVALVV